MVRPVTTKADPATEPRKGLPHPYLTWLAGALTSQLGSAAMFFALGWAATVHGGTAAGLVLSSVVLPRTVLLLLGGAVGDRLGARAVMITCDAAMFGVALVLAVCASSIGTPLALLLCAGLLIGTSDAFYLPSSGSMPRRLVDGPALGRAVALRQSGSQLVMIVGGPLGGALVALAGFAAAAWVNSASFLVVLAVLVAIRPRFAPPAAAARKHIVREALDGVVVAVGTPGLGVVLPLVAAAAGFILPVSSLLIPLLAREHGWQAGAAGALVGVVSAGTVVATLVVARTGTHRRPGVVACGGLLLTSGGQLLIGVGPAIGWAFIGAAGAGVGAGLFISHLTPVLLEAAPDTHVARVQALFALVQSLALLATNNVLGNLAHAFTAATAIAGCAAVLTLCATAGLASRTVRTIT